MDDDICREQVPLMTREQYEKFSELRERLDGNNIANIFVPIGPSKSKSKACVLYVGRATRDYGGPGLGSFEGALNAGVCVINRRKFAFWAFLRRIVQKATLETRGDVYAEEAVSVAWSNLVKIGSTTGNPRADTCRMQAELCKKALRYEIDALKPTAVIVATGLWQQEEILDPVFNTGTWSDLPTGNGRVMMDNMSKALVVHTPHPQGLRGSVALAEVIGERLASHLEHQAATRT